MKKILGLDIGTTSIGWAIVEATDLKKINHLTEREPETDINNDRVGIYKDEKNGYAVGVRIIKQDTDSIGQFNAGLKMNLGAKATPTALRRQKRGSRKLNSRYKLRRQKLNQVLDFLGMLPEGVSKNIDTNNNVTYAQNKNSKYYTAQKGKRGDEQDLGKAIYELRNRAAREEISLQEWGRIMLHLNQWRGYSSDRFSIEEKPKFNYYTATVLEIDLENKKPTYVDDKAENKEVKYYEIKIKIRLDEAINISDDEENQDFVTEFEGFIYKKELSFLMGEPICVKKPEKKQDKKGKIITREYYKIEQTIPDPTDFNFKLQTLTKSLTDYCINGKTVGSYFYQNFYVNKSKDLERIRTNIVNRNFYEAEFDTIFDFQFAKHQNHFSKFSIEDIVASAFGKKNKSSGKDNPAYTQILNEVNNLKIEFEENGEKKKRDATKAEKIRYLLSKVIIYYQRPWQQAKNKGRCEFEFVQDVMLNPEYNEGVDDKKLKYTPNTKNPDKKIVDKDGIEHCLKGRTVIPRSHPLHQEFKIWTQINNVKLLFVNHDVQLELMKFNTDECKNITGFSTIAIKEKLYRELRTHSEINWRTFAEGLLKETKIPLIVLGIGKGKKMEEDKLPDLYFTVNYTKRNKKTKEVQDDKLKGNKTLYQIEKILNKENKNWYAENWKTSSDKHKENTKPRFEKGQYKICDYQITNLQLLWEIIYDISISDSKKVSELIQKKFEGIISKEQADLLSKIKFDDAGMSNLSAKAIRNLLPLMSDGKNTIDKVDLKIDFLLELNKKESNNIDDGYTEKLESLKDFIPDRNARKQLATLHTKEQFQYLNYWEAAAIVYGSHSTKIVEGNFKAIEVVKQHSMNNPVVEKIVNETIRVVNDIYKIYGFDEVRIELSRELKASAEEREQMTEGRDKNTKQIEWAKEMIRELKGTLQSDNRDSSNIDNSYSNSNIDKIRIMDDVATERFSKLKTETQKTNPQPTKSEIQKYILWVEQNYRCPYTNHIIPLTDVFDKNKVVQIEHILPRERYPNNSFSNKVITWERINKEKSYEGNRTAFEFICSKRSSLDKFYIPSINKEVKLVLAEEWDSHIKNLFPKGSKQRNLLRSEIPQGFVERQLKETQYINKKITEKLGELVGNNKVWTTTGQVTDILRDSWHLNEVMQTLSKDRFVNFKVTKNKPHFEIKIQNQQEKLLEEIEDMLALGNPVFTILKNEEKSLIVNDSFIIDEIQKSLSIFHDNTKKITNTTTYIFKSEINTVIDFEVKGAELIEQNRVSIKEAKEKNTACKIILVPEDKYETTDIEEIETIKDELQNHLNECEEEDKSKPFKYFPNSNVSLLTDVDTKQGTKPKLAGFNKRIDHRHHALDAIIIANTKQSHIQYINKMNAINSADLAKDGAMAYKYKKLKEEVCGDSSKCKITPWVENKFIPDVQKALENIIISQKNTNVLISPSKNKQTPDSKNISIRGNLHKETNYAKRSYVDMTEKGKVNIKSLVDQILKAKLENQEYRVELPKTFEKIIQEKIFKIKYQNVMIKFFEPYKESKLCKGETENEKIPIEFIKKEIYKILDKEKPFKNKQGEVLTWLRAFSVKRASARPNGLTINLNIAGKEGLKGIANPRLLRIAKYRLEFINQEIKKIENDNSFSKEDKEIEKNKIKGIKLFSNGLYEVRVKTTDVKNPFKWIEIKDLQEIDLQNIEFVKEETTIKAKEKINKIGLTEYKKKYIIEPICLSSHLIEVKKARKLGWFQELYEIHPKQFVYALDSYMFFVYQKQNAERIIKPLKFIEAVRDLQELETKKVTAQILMPKHNTDEELMFTLQGNDLVYLPDEGFDITLISQINWNNINEISSKLYVVKDMNASGPNVVFAKINTAAAIAITKKDVQSMFGNEFNKNFTEEIKYGKKDMLQRCIKLFTNRLGTKIVPYWEFKNGIWDNKRAIDLGLMQKPLTND